MIQEKLGQTDGVECVISYDGPDFWKAVIYAKVPFKSVPLKPDPFKTAQRSSTKVSIPFNRPIIVLTPSALGLLV